jgi:DNA-directed RNA polymerase specialized sigma24 family protein
MVVHIASAGLQVDASVDLRRKRTRDMAEVIADHAQWTLPDDKALLRAIYRDGMTAQRIAQLRSQSARTVRARVRRLVARVSSDRFRFVVRHREKWPVHRRSIATACVLQGMSMRDAAAFLHLSFHQVRREMGIVEALMAEDRRPGRTANGGGLSLAPRQCAPAHASDRTGVRARATRIAPGSGLTMEHRAP